MFVTVINYLKIYMKYLFYYQTNLLLISKQYDGKIENFQDTPSSCSNVDRQKIKNNNHLC